jgi:DNA-binding NarL/FixJ family response regulator
MSSHGQTRSVVLVDHRDLNRTCLGLALASTLHDCSVLCFASIHDLRASGLPADTVILSLAEQRAPVLSAMLHAARDSFATALLVVLSEHASDQLVATTIASGARAYLTTDATPELLAATVQMILLGGTSFPPSCAGKTGMNGGHSREDTLSRLTSREQEVLLLVGEGAQNKTIAFKLSMSENTVKVHLHRILQKLRLHNRTELALAMRNYSMLSSQHKNTSATALRKNTAPSLTHFQHHGAGARPAAS